MRVASAEFVFRPHMVPFCGVIFCCERTRTEAPWLRGRISRWGEQWGGDIPSPDKGVMGSIVSSPALPQPKTETILVHSKRDRMPRCWFHVFSNHQSIGNQMCCHTLCVAPKFAEKIVVESWGGTCPSAS